MGNRVIERASGRHKARVTEEAQTAAMAQASHIAVFGSPGGQGYAKTTGLEERVNEMEKRQLEILRQFDPNRRDSLISTVNHIAKMIENGGGHAST